MGRLQALVGLRTGVRGLFQQAGSFVKQAERMLFLGRLALESAVQNPAQNQRLASLWDAELLRRGNRGQRGGRTKAPRVPRGLPDGGQLLPRTASNGRELVG